MFAMLTGTLPFTVEPFDLQNLHHKMVAGDIAHVPGDISQGLQHPRRYSQKVKEFGLLSLGGRGGAALYHVTFE